MPRLIAAVVAALVLAVAAPAIAQTPQHSVENTTVTSRADDTAIAISVFKPATASADSQVPVLLSSHGWGGTRGSAISGVQAYLDAGLGVVSIDQRGHGASEGEANVQDPELETEDIKAVIDHIATLDWVLHDTSASGAPIANDPVLGAIGGSYGGGYQTMTALDEIADEGRTRLNAIAPEITWYDLPESLAPQKVTRTAWVTLLYAAGAPMVPQYIHEAFAWGAATGLWPDGTTYGQPAPGIVPDLDSEFHTHSPVYFAEQDIKIDIPVLLRQGTSDNLFNLNQGLDIFQKAVTDQARQESYFVAYNGGHALPTALPRGTAGGSDACTGDWTQLRIDFFKSAFAGDTGGVLPKRYNFTNLDGSGCLRFNKLDPSTIDVDLTGENATISTAALGAPLHIPVAEGPINLTGVPTLKGTMTSLGLDNRAFFGLAVGTSPADATVLQNNMMPLRGLRPQVDRPFGIELPGVSAEIAEGQTLFLTVSPLSDMYFGHGSRVPGGFLLTDLSLSLPEPIIPLETLMKLERMGKEATSRLVATVTEKAGGAPVAGVPVRFSSGDVALGTATTNDEGVATLGIRQGKYRHVGRAFLAEFAGTDSYDASSATTVAPRHPAP
jgi:pimeloyl-ACP methyl ester carboxylesterase